MSSVNISLRQPLIWGFDRGLVSPDWETIWKHSLLSTIMWDATTPINLVDRKPYNSISSASQFFVQTNNGLGLNADGVSVSTAIANANIAEVTALTDEITVAAFVIPGDGTRGDLINQWGANGVRHFDLLQGVTASRFTFFVSTDGTASINSGASTTPIVAGVPHFVVGTYDRANIRIYVDGIQENSAAQTAAMFTTSSVGVELGDNDNDDGPFLGQILLGAVLSKALTAGEIQHWSRDPFGPFRMIDESVGIVPAVTISYPPWKPSLQYLLMR